MPGHNWEAILETDNLFTTTLKAFYTPSGAMKGWGAGSPTAAETGWAKGCIFQDITNGKLYLNTGDTTSSTWSLIPDASTAITTAANVGTAGSSATAAEYGDGYRHTTVLTGVSIAHAVGNGSAEAVTGVVYTFPEGAIIVHGTLVDLVVSAPSITDNDEIGLGSAAAADDDTLTNTEEDILTGAAGGAITAAGTDYEANGLPGTSPVLLDGTAGAKTVNLNLCSGTGNTWGAADTITITGTVTILWSYLGDY